MAKTIRLTYDRKCPDCSYISEGEVDWCPKHWAELERQSAIIHAVEGDVTMEEALRRLMVEGE